MVARQTSALGRGAALAFLLTLFCWLAGCGQSPSAETQTAAAKPASPPSLPSEDELRTRLDRVREETLARQMNAESQAAWQIVHGILAYGRDLTIKKTKAGGEPVVAIDYLLEGGRLEGWNLRPGDPGVIAVIEAGTGKGQGHPDQWLGYLSQIGLPPEAAIVVEGREFKVSDLLLQAQYDVYDGMEASWTLMAFSRYMPLDAEWTAKDGTTWNTERILKMEANYPVGDGPCGGAHRLYGLATAVNAWTGQGHDLTGTWKTADDRIQEAIRLAREYQQPDGLLSANFFQRAGSANDIGQQMRAAGHVLEFLVLAMSDKQLAEPWVTRAVVKLCDLFDKTKDLEMECGALYHAAHGLELYRLRKFGPRGEEPSSAPENAPSSAPAPAEAPATAAVDSGASAAK